MNQGQTPLKHTAVLVSARGYNQAVYVIASRCLLNSNSLGHAVCVYINKILHTHMIHRNIR